MKKVIIHVLCNILGFFPNVLQHIKVCFHKHESVRISGRKYFFKDIATGQSAYKAIAMSKYFKAEFEDYYI